MGGTLIATPDEPSRERALVQLAVRHVRWRAGSEARRHVAMAVLAEWPESAELTDAELAAVLRRFKG